MVSAPRMWCAEHDGGNAVSEDQTLDLRIMRPTRYQLRYHRCVYLVVSLQRQLVTSKPSEADANTSEPH
jgi:hypothetical protein